MKAVLVKRPGDVDQMIIGDFPKPECGKEEILVRVKATALNRADLLQRRGYYPPPEGASPLMGLEAAGVVEEVGENCRETWKIGDRVFALLPSGGYAEYVIVPKKMALPIPDGITFVEAASIPEAFLTAFQTLFWVGRLGKGEHVLIHAGAGGVGSAAIQLARAAGAIPLVTVGSEKKQKFCLALGAEHAFNYKEGDFAPRVLEATEGRGVDLVLDFVGAPYFKQNIEVLKMDGRWVLIGTLGGSRLEQASLAPVLNKRLQITGTTLRSRSLDYKVRLSQEFASFAFSRLESGEIRPVIDRVFPFEQVKEAHRYMEENKNCGKIVLNLE
ncbi:NAD(P)H-quinone oxidoreductase [Thermoactinomyces mirandus]|uniref:NAD(P)H-quinone oxidoreductase n=1 Tax=Thermoactinomyces mirandus TaxID=2756294 RepID=A0A7W1XQS1_9BACL|nr:NAD(P)H-quinone oxidoreductase [Thermoactinomyces mirandus]MBA4601557.1 NAD(P)H-quinone oxidoreductase [Thermoactinomyces mirandus]